MSTSSRKGVFIRHFLRSENKTRLKSEMEKEGEKLEECFHFMLVEYIHREMDG